MTLYLLEALEVFPSSFPLHVTDTRHSDLSVHPSDAVSGAFQMEMLFMLLQPPALQQSPDLWCGHHVLFIVVVGGTPLCSML